MPIPLSRSLPRIAILIAAALTAAMIAASSAAAVADGAPAALGQYPFAVKLTMTHIPRPNGTYYESACSAALISPTWVITAGHCFHDVNRIRVSGPVPYATTATLNTPALNTAALNTAAGGQRAGPGQWFDFLSATPFENTDVTVVQQSATSDIALARLSTPVTDVRPLGLSETGPDVGTVLTIAGWGAISGFLPTPSARLSIGQVKIQAVKATTIAVVGSSPGADTSACLYDSGAPYFTTSPNAPPLLLATESTGPNCPHSDAETTARVDNITEWIKAIVTDQP